MPPMPTAAIFSISLGALYPILFPSTFEGTIVRPAAAIAPVSRNFLLEMLVDISTFFICVTLS